MIITKAHVDYWMLKKGFPKFAKPFLDDRPFWGPQIRGPELIINRCVNAHAPAWCKALPDQHYYTHNTMNLVSSTQRRGEDLVAYMQEVNERGGGKESDKKRQALFVRWIRRLQQQRRNANKRQETRCPS